MVGRSRHRAYELCGALLDEGRAEDVDAEMLRRRVFADAQGAPQAICAVPDPARGQARIQTLFNIVMTFVDGRAPSAEVVFGRPGSREESSVRTMPW